MKSDELLFAYELTLIECVNKSVNTLNFVLFLPFDRTSVAEGKIKQESHTSETFEVTANICEALGHIAPMSEDDTRNRNFQELRSRLMIYQFAKYYRRWVTEQTVVIGEGIIATCASFHRTVL